MKKRTKKFQKHKIIKGKKKCLEILALFGKWKLLYVLTKICLKISNIFNIFFIILKINAIYNICIIILHLKIFFENNPFYFLRIKFVFCFLGMRVLFFLKKKKMFSKPSSNMNLRFLSPFLSWRKCIRLQFFFPHKIFCWNKW